MTSTNQNQQEKECVQINNQPVENNNQKNCETLNQEKLRNEIDLLRVEISQKKFVPISTTTKVIVAFLTIVISLATVLVSYFDVQTKKIEALANIDLANKKLEYDKISFENNTAFAKEKFQFSQKLQGVEMQLKLTQFLVENWNKISDNSSENEIEFRRAITAIFPTEFVNEAITDLLYNPQLSTDEIDFLTKTITPDEETYDIDIKILYRKGNDKNTIQSIAKKIKSSTTKKIRVSSTGKVNKPAGNGSVRYFSEDMKSNAQEMADTIKEHLNCKNIEMVLIPLLNMYPNVPKNRLEIWLPSLKNCKLKP